MNEACLGRTDYDFSSLKQIAVGGQSQISMVKNMSQNSLR